MNTNSLFAERHFRDSEQNYNWRTIRHVFLWLDSPSGPSFPHC